MEIGCKILTEVPACLQFLYEPDLKHPFDITLHKHKYGRFSDTLFKVQCSFKTRLKASANDPISHYKLLINIDTKQLKLLQFLKLLL